MSARLSFRCPECYHEVETWDCGHPYILDDAGERHFFYHPAERDVIDAVIDRSAWARGKTATQVLEELPAHCGCMSDVMCCGCGEVWKVDELSPALSCSKCRSADVVEPLKLGGKTCFKCKRGRFPDEPELSGIS